MAGMTQLKSVRFEKKPPPPPQRPDIDKLEAALNETSRRAAAQWFGFLSLWAYLFFTTVSVTDYDLLVLPTIRIPLVGVDMGLFSFFVWAPALFFIVHLYIARKVVLMARRIEHFLSVVRDDALENARRTERESRVDPFVITALLARFDRSADSPSGGFLHILTWATVFTTLFVLPIALYGAFQVFFLAYQHEAMTWWHRSLLIAGTALSFFTLLRAGVFTGRRRRLGIAATLAPASAFVMASLFLLTFPGEPIREWSDAQRHPYSPDREPITPSVRQLEYFRHERKNSERSIINWIPDRLSPHQPESLFLEAKRKSGSATDANTLDLSGRRFSNRSLRGASFIEVNLDNAQFENVQLDSASFVKTNLTNATFLKSEGSGIRFFQSRANNLLFEKSKFPKMLFWDSTVEHISMMSGKYDRILAAGTALDGMKIENSDISHSSFTNSDLSACEIFKSDASLIHFQHSKLDACRIYQAKFQQDLFDSSSAKGIEIAYSSVNGSAFEGSDFRLASFVRSNIENITDDDSNFDGIYFIDPFSEYFIDCDPFHQAQDPIAEENCKGVTTIWDMDYFRQYYSESVGYFDKISPTPINNYIREPSNINKEKILSKNKFWCMERRSYLPDDDASQPDTCQGEYDPSIQVGCRWPPSPKDEDRPFSTQICIDYLKSRSAMVGKDDRALALTKAVCADELGDGSARNLVSRIRDTVQPNLLFHAVWENPDEGIPMDISARLVLKAFSDPENCPAARALSKPDWNALRDIAKREWEWLQTEEALEWFRAAGITPPKEVHDVKPRTLPPPFWP